MIHLPQQARDGAGNRPMRHLNLSGFQILVLDPDPFFRTILRQILRGFGCQGIVEAAAAEDALRLLGDAEALPPVDVVITEWADLGMAGAGFLQQTRRLPGETAMLPVIVITHRTARRDVLAARDAGATELLVKPVSPRLLFDRLYDVIHEPRLFVRAPNYVGPDRRRFRSFDYRGSERRGRAPAPQPAEECA